MGFLGMSLTFAHNFFVAVLIALVATSAEAKTPQNSDIPNIIHTLPGPAGKAPRPRRYDPTAPCRQAQTDLDNARERWRTSCSPHGSLLTEIEEQYYACVETLCPAMAEFGEDCLDDSIFEADPTSTYGCLGEAAQLRHQMQVCDTLAGAIAIAQANLNKACGGGNNGF